MTTSALKSPAGAAKPWFRRRPRLALVTTNLVLLAVLLVAAEVFLRLYLSHDPGYYMDFPRRPGIYQYPYGTVIRNSEGYPDEEFDLTSTAPRIGYFGDSVTRGVGAGHGFRVTDVLEDMHPEYEHWTFGSATSGIDEERGPEILDIARQYELSRVVYLLNLNDILPSRRDEREDQPTLIVRVKENLKWLDWLRGKSYVYSLLRSSVRNVLAARGFGYHGYKAYELFPSENAEVVRETAERILNLGDELEKLDVRFTVALIPYEMQISEEAARIYREFGIAWEDDFLAGSTQAALIRHFDDRVHYVDAYQAFVRADDPANSRQANKIGEYFVHDRGGKLDWNHPNRDGCRRIAEHLSRNGLLE